MGTARYHKVPYGVHRVPRGSYGSTRFLVLPILESSDATLDVITSNLMLSTHHLTFLLMNLM